MYWCIQTAFLDGRDQSVLKFFEMATNKQYQLQVVNFNWSILDL